VGPGCVIGPRVVIGRECVLRPGAIVQQDTVMGDRNTIGHHAVIGGDPQDRAYDPATPGRLEIGDDNIFREFVSLHRSTEPGPATVIGSNNFLMASSHVGHNCRVDDRNTFANSTALAGHVRMGSDNVLSSCVGLHQFVDVGDLTMFRHSGGASAHVPPFVIVSGINVIAGVNRVGLSRHPDYGEDDAVAVRKAFKAIYRSRGAGAIGETAAALLAEERSPAARRFLSFFGEVLAHEDPRRQRRGIAAHPGSRG